MAAVRKLKVSSNVTFKEMSEKLLYVKQVLYLKQVKMHPKFMLFLMLINLIQLKMQIELEDHLGKCSFATLSQHKR